MNRDIVRQIINVLTVIATLTVNGLANALPLNGQMTGEISDRFKVFFVPAGYVFSIWGIIYLGLLAFAIYQALPAQRQNPNLRRIGYWPVLAGVANSVWIFLWHYEQFALTLVAMLILLASLIVTYVWLGIGRSRVSRGERWAVHLTFSIYLGWISVATIANVTSLLDYLRWDGWGIAPELWTVIMLAVAAGLAWTMALTRRDAAYLLVLIWAFAGIAFKHAAVPLVMGAAWAAVVLVAAALVAGIGLNRIKPMAV